MRFSFDVGQQERHRVDFCWSQMTGALRLAVDGAVIAHKSFTLSSRTNLLNPLDIPDAEKWKLLGKLEVEVVQKWTFEVGAQERHQVRIEKEREKLFAPLRPHTYRVFVDGQLVDSQRGY